jgi:hypothetical protein
MRFALAMVLRTSLTICITASAAVPARAQDRSPSATNQRADELARAVANPIAHLISVPLQNDLDFGIGHKNRAVQNTLNAEPVIPVNLGGGWSMITRTILPFVYHQSAFPGDRNEFGLGDTSFSAFFTRAGSAAPGALMFGAGPMIRLPTATDAVLGQRRWAAGPTAIALQQTQNWTFGMLASHVWSIGDSMARPGYSLTSLQPFIVRQFGGGFSLSANLEATYDWDSKQTVVPLNIRASQIVHIGPLPVSLFAGPRIYLQRPNGGPDWGLRFGAQFLFPT